MRKSLLLLAILAAAAANLVLPDTAVADYFSDDDWICGSQGPLQVCTTAYFSICGNESGGDRPDCATE